jgi:hypothetical protein
MIPRDGVGYVVNKKVIGNTSLVCTSDCEMIRVGPCDGLTGTRYAQLKNGGHVKPC